MKKFLMCPPKYFGIEYQINPWMDTSVEVDKNAAKKIYEELKNIYKSLDIEVLEIEAEKGFPDMVYASNLGYAEKNIFIKANFKPEQRRKESDFGYNF
ncbi:MAG: hypothetical protein ABI550_01825, partial [Ignavibacteriaceae bacterium]